MNKEYKKHAINGLYGLICGTHESLQQSFVKWFKRLFNVELNNPENTNNTVSVTSTYGEVYIEEWKSLCWAGTMAVHLTIDGELYEVTRNWGEEHRIDSNHPNYRLPDGKLNLDFNETNDCYASIRAKQLLDELK